MWEPTQAAERLWIEPGGSGRVRSLGRRRADPVPPCRDAAWWSRRKRSSLDALRIGHCGRASRKRTVKKTDQDNGQGRHDSMKHTLIGAVLALGLAGGPAMAEWQPSGPINLWIGFGAGGGTDTQARTLVEELEERRGWKIVPSNKAGGGGAVMAAQLKEAPADGQTIGFAINTTFDFATLGSGQYRRRRLHLHHDDLRVAGRRARAGRQRLDDAGGHGRGRQGRRDDRLGQLGRPGRGRSGADRPQLRHRRQPPARRWRPRLGQRARRRGRERGLGRRRPARPGRRGRGRHPRLRRAGPAGAGPRRARR